MFPYECFTNKFLKNQWQNISFQLYGKSIKEIMHIDAYCVRDIISRAVYVMPNPHNKSIKQLLLLFQFTDEETEAGKR